MTAVIFDFGNVIVDWDPFAALCGLFTDRVEMSAALDRLGFAGWNKAQDLGRAWSEGLDAARDMGPEHAQAFGAYHDGLAAAHDRLVPGTCAVITALNEAGHPIYGLTDANPATIEMLQPSIPELDLMRDIVVSSELGIAKPDPAIFHHLLERNGLDPRGCVFIDDSAENCAAATGLGFDAIRFENAEALAAALVSRGLL